MEAIKKTKEVAAKHYREHQQGFSPVHQGNKLADKLAKEAARQGILALIPENIILIPSVSNAFKGKRKWSGLVHNSTKSGNNTCTIKDTNSQR